MPHQSFADTPHHSHAPVIVFGMHRSGTSMISLMLRELGVFMGKDLQRDGESRTFLTLNEQVFIKTPAASWDRPQPVADFLGDPANLERFSAFLRSALADDTMKKYLGEAPGRAASSLHLDRPWGWKDPRNTYTLPAWLRIFPYARLIHVLRNGIDVAESLRERHRTVLETHTRNYGAPPPAEGMFRLGQVKFTHRPATLAGGFSLWQEYVGHARRMMRTGGARALEIRYESICENPPAAMERLAGFLGITPDREAAARLNAQIKAENGYKFRSRPDLLEFARQVRYETMFGYRPVVCRILHEQQE